jgi:hypothetical protein
MGDNTQRAGLTGKGAANECPGRLEAKMSVKLMSKFINLYLALI